MPIPNVATLYQKIRKGSEGGHEFSRMISVLLAAEYSSKNDRLQLFSDASGDYNGLDAVIFGDEPFPEVLTGFQFKFFPQNFTDSHKANIKSSLMAAMKSNPFMKLWILVTPEDFLKNDLEWFDKLKEKTRRSEKKNFGSTHFSFEIKHWGHSNIIELCLKHEHIGRRYFPEIFHGKHDGSHSVKVCFENGLNSIIFNPKFIRFTKIYRPQTEEEKLEESEFIKAAFDSAVENSESGKWDFWLKKIVNLFRRPPSQERNGN